VRSFVAEITRARLTFQLRDLTKEVPMETRTALVRPEPLFSDVERIALIGFLAGYRGLTREACALDLRQFSRWCAERNLALFAVARVDIEMFGRTLEAAGRARATSLVVSAPSPASTATPKRRA
jgi:hypothetical protein